MAASLTLLFVVLFLQHGSMALSPPSPQSQPPRRQLSSSRAAGGGIKAPHLNQMNKKKLCDEVKQIIEKWVKDLHGNQPNETQNEKLKRSLFDLDKRVETQARTASDVEQSSTSKTMHDLPGDITPDTSKPSTLKELAEYILDTFTDEKLKELGFIVVLSKSANIYFTTRVETEEALKDAQNDQIDHIKIGEYFAEEKSIQAAYNHIQGLLGTTEDLITKINRRTLTRVSPEDNVLEWDEDLVKPTDESDLRHIVFCSDISKASALVVSGESGSGKTWFATNYIPKKLGEQDLALIYYSIEENDGHAKIESDKSCKYHKMACGKGMMYLRDQKLEAQKLSDRGHDDLDLALGDVYQCLSNLSMEYNKNRDTEAYNWLIATIEKCFHADPVVMEWWTSQHNTKTIKKLVLVVDEVGKNPELARGLVSKVRELYQHIKEKGQAKQVLLVLVGSGLDRHIRYDRLASFGGEATQDKIASFGTDPMKSKVITLRGPVLQVSRDKVYGIPTNSILRGAYSRTLSTNTRMLTRGVLPMMKIPQFTAHMDADKIPARYQALGSTNIVMDYAARHYITLNGLAEYNSLVVNSKLLTQFNLLLYASLFPIKHKNPACEKIMTDLPIEFERDFDEISALGLVTADITSTSNALRYLACNGSTAPVDAQDGIGFEIMVQYHLVRLSEAYNSRLQDSSQGHAANHWVGQYNLRHAWPPPSSLGNHALIDYQETMKEVQQKYRNTSHDDDIKTIMEILKDKGDFDLILRQTVSNTQGADLMILSRKDESVHLHLFQCKHLESMPTVRSQKLMKFFWSLGVKIDQGKNSTVIECEPKDGSAGYSYLGTLHLAQKLGKELGNDVKIGNRTLVFSQECKQESKQEESDFLDLALEKGVMVWTQEMLEPTRSALYGK